MHEHGADIRHEHIDGEFIHYHDAGGDIWSLYGGPTSKASPVHYPLLADGSRDPRDAWGLLADAVGLLDRFRQHRPRTDLESCDPCAFLASEPIAAIAKRRKERDR